VCSKLDWIGGTHTRTTPPIDDVPLPRKVEDGRDGIYDGRIAVYR
jgi:hypothetical protein